MAKIYDSLNSLINNDMVVQAASALGENESQVRSGVSVILPSLLTKLLEKGKEKEVGNIVKEAGKIDLYPRIGQLFTGRGIADGVNLGEHLKNQLVGSNNSEYNSAVASETGMSAANVGRLTIWISGVIAAFFGSTMLREKRELPELLDQLYKERKSFENKIPTKTARALNLMKDNGTVQKKNNMNWLWWVLAIILLIVIIVLIARSCNSSTTRTARVIETPENVTTVVDRANTRDIALNDASATRSVTRSEIITRSNNAYNALERAEVTLSNGIKVRIVKNGMEQQMINFLNSNDYKNATDTQLRNKWFHFDSIDFVHDSATEMTLGSREQLNNIATILKSYPNVKVSIGGYADRTGGTAVNQEISEERAQYVKTVFVNNGINADRISTEGFGKEFATHPASASDAERAEDRSIALRFYK